MTPRRGATGLRGILLIDKPFGPTSHDVVDAVRRTTGEGRVGHAGTLDPMATGLLIVLVGVFTRLEPFISGEDKTYRARIAFGFATDTDDALGKQTRTGPPSPELLDPDFARTTLSGFVGRMMQRPPAFSAIKVAGQAAYRSARRGRPVDLEPRPVEVHVARLVDISSEPASWTVDFVVSKGTYVRALARDIGQAVGVPAHLAELRRVRIGTLDVAQAYPLDLITSSTAHELGERFADPFEVLGMPVVDASPSMVADGRAFRADAPSDERVAVRVEGRFGGVYRRSRGLLVPDVFISTVDGAA